MCECGGLLVECGCAAHEINIPRQGRKQRWLPTCTCGWTGSVCRSQVAAAESAVAHRMADAR